VYATIVIRDVDLLSNYKVMKFIGIDIAKESFVVAYRRLTEFKTAEFTNDVKGIKKFIASFDHSDHHCVMEATGNYGTLLLYMLCNCGIATSLINPKQTKHFARMMMATIKSDQVDAKLIALYGEKMRPEIYRMPPKHIIDLKQQRVVLRQFKKQLTALKNLKGALDVLPNPDKKSLSILTKTISFLMKQIGLVEEELHSIVTESYHSQIKSLTSIPGIGMTIASALIITTGGFSQFENAKQVSRYIGICPTYQQSGTSIKIRGSINRNGDSDLRSLLYLASWSAIRYNGPCKEFYRRLKSNGKPSKLALVAVANKLLRQAFAVCRSGGVYSAEYLLETPSVDLAISTQ